MTPLSSWTDILSCFVFFLLVFYVIGKFFIYVIQEVGNSECYLNKERKPYYIRITLIGGDTVTLYLEEEEFEETFHKFIDENGLLKVNSVIGNIFTGDIEEKRGISIPHNAIIKIEFFNGESD